MAEYINTKAFLTDIMDRYCMKCDDANGTRCLACWVADMQDEIVEAPAADVAPVVHGRWAERKRPTEHLMCSACCRKNFMRVKSTYCPNCGARMDGK